MVRAGTTNRKQVMSGKDKRYKEKQSGKTKKSTEWASAA